MADVQFSISIDSKLKDKIEDLAKSELRSISSQIEWILKKWIVENE